MYEDDSSDDEKGEKPEPAKPKRWIQSTFGDVVKPLEPIVMPVFGPAPAQIHREDGTTWDVHAGAMWSVAMPLATARPHLETLTLCPNEGKQYAAGAVAKRYPIGRYENGRLYMPASYARLAFPNVTTFTRTTLTRGEPMRAGVVFGGKLFDGYPPQKQAARRYGEWLRENLHASSVAMVLPCGFGKSALAVAIAAMLGRVTLVVIHTLPLVDQWIAEARRFLPAGRIGYVRSGTRRIENVDMIIASTSTLVKAIDTNQPWLARLWQRVGFFVQDEAHFCAAQTFARVVQTCPAMYRLMLTATLRRHDGLTEKMLWLTGPQVFKAHRRPNEIHAVCVRYINDMYRERHRGKFLAMDLMVDDLIADRVRTEAAVAIIKQLVAQDRRVLVVTPRKEHLAELADAVELALRAGTGAGAGGGFVPPARTVDLFVPEPAPRKRRKLKHETAEEAEAEADKARFAWEDSGPHGSVETRDVPLVGRVLQGMEDLERKLQYNATVVVCTSDIISVGVSHTRWDTLVDLCNGSDPEQLVGRILRANDEKRVPLIVDMWSPIGIFQGLFWKRHKTYKREDMTIHHVEARDVSELPPPEFWETFNKPAPAMF